MNLVIVESPTKAKTIGKFLGKEYEIKASMGHVVDLPKSTLGVDLEKDFAPLYEMVPDKEPIVTDLKALAKKADSIILATDPDREGEAIASHIKDMLSSNSKFKIQNSKFHRVVFHEITEGAINESFKHPRSIDQNLVDAQTARRVLDRLVGYKLSPILWQKVRRGLSAGRVQSVALRLIVEREKEIEKFKKEQYFTIHVILKKGTARLPAPEGAADGGQVFELLEINTNRIETQEKFDLYDGEYTISKTSIDTAEKAKKIVEHLHKKEFIVAEVDQKETKRSPLAPYTTSTLQQDAARRLGLPGKRTMGIAQKLYEEGYITYHRTDSVTMAVSSQNAIIGYVKKEFGEKYVQLRSYTTKQKLAQEAHEAIRPTKVGVLAAVVSQDLGGAYGKLYDLIWKRAVSSQMSDALIESTVVIVETKGEGDNYTLKANGSVLLFDGFLKVNPQALNDTKLPQFKKDEKLILKEAKEELHETPPPPRYNDASLIKTLEEKGIGRPSTYASIISTIQDRQYIEREENRFSPTNVGVAVNGFLVTNFSDIDDIPFTAEMEDQLDDIAHGKKEWVPMMKHFYTPFSEQLKEVKKAERVEIPVEKTDEKCEKCGAFMVVRIGRFGKFLSCSKFPDCDFKKPFVEETKFDCPKCGGPPRVGESSESRRGKVIIKKTKKGRRFYGCSNYPKCDFAAWNLKDFQVKKESDTKKDSPEQSSGGQV